MAGHRRNRKRMQTGTSMATSDCSVKRKKANALEDGESPERKKTSAPEEGETPVRKKVFMRMSPTDILLGKKPKEILPAGAPEKRTKVVRKRLPQSLVEHIAANPYLMPVFTADELAEETEYYREFYAKARHTADRIEAYQQGIIDQFKSFGYAEEDTEVTDEDDDNGSS